MDRTISQRVSATANIDYNELQILKATINRGLFFEVLMLTLRFNLNDAGSCQAFYKETIELKTGFIEKFDSSLLTISTNQIDGNNRVWIGEDVDPAGGDDSCESPSFYRAYTLCEGIKIHFREVTGVRSEVIISRTAAGSSPLYIHRDEDVVNASWMFDFVANSIKAVKLNKESCLRYLESGPSLMRQQIFEDMFMLWPGESVLLSSSDTVFVEADEPNICVPAPISDSARVTEEFMNIIASAMQRCVSRAKHPIIELSGGLDSSCAAFAAHNLSSSLVSYGLIHDGSMGVQQSNRREELISILGIKDFKYPSFKYPPLAGLDLHESCLTPFDDNHRISCAYAIDNHPEKGIDVLISGIGGDELTMEYTFIRQEFEIRGNICSSALVAATARADMFMRRGIWPQNPFISQQVVDFCRAIPKTFRVNRLLNVLSLARVGLSDGFLFPRYSEHYGHIMQREAAEYDYDLALYKSAIADSNISDISGLLEEARKASYGGFSYQLITRLFNLLKLEKVIQKYL